MFATDLGLTAPQIVGICRLEFHSRSYAADQEKSRRPLENLAWGRAACIGARAYVCCYLPRGRGMIKPVGRRACLRTRLMWVASAVLVASCQATPEAPSARPGLGSRVLIDRQVSGDLPTDLLTSKTHAQRLPAIRPTSSWTIRWSFNCSNYGNHSGYFGIYLHGSREHPRLVVEWDTQKDGVVSGLKPGTYTLEVSSLCGWHIIVAESTAASAER